MIKFPQIVQLTVLEGREFLCQALGWERKWLILSLTQDLYFYLDELDEFSDFDNEDKLLLVEKNIGFGDYSNTLEKDFVIECTPKLQNNGSLYGHFYMVPTGTQLVAGQDPESVIYHKKGH